MNLKLYLENNPKLDRFSFGEFVRQRRIEVGYSVREFSKYINVTPSYVSDIEKGNRYAPKTLLNEIASILAIDEEDKNDFIDLAYLSCGTCSPDLIQYLIASKEARFAIRYLTENNITGKELLEIITNKDENFKNL